MQSLIAGPCTAMDEINVHSALLGTKARACTSRLNVHSALLGTKARACTSRLNVHSALLGTKARACTSRRDVKLHETTIRPKHVLCSGHGENCDDSVFLTCLLQCFVVAAVVVYAFCLNYSLLSLFV